MCRVFCLLESAFAAWHRNYSSHKLLFNENLGRIGCAICNCFIFNSSNELVFNRLNH
jgi:hypothetical protein